MSSKIKIVAVAITTVALTAGSFGVATASSKSTKVTRTSFSNVANQAQAGKLGRGQELASILSGLVAKGTITQAQADAIIAALDAAKAARDAQHPEMGGRGDRDGDRDGDRGHGGPRGGGMMGGTAPTIPTPTTAAN